MTDVFHLPPEGAHEGLEGFRVEDPTGRALGEVAAVERDGKHDLLLLVRPADRGRSKSVKALGWDRIEQIDLNREAIRLTSDGANGLARAAAIHTDRLRADDDSIVRFVPVDARVAMPSFRAVEPASWRPVASIALTAIALLPLFGVIVFLSLGVSAIWAWLLLPLELFAAAALVLIPRRWRTTLE